MAVADRVPAAGAIGEAVGVELTLGGGGLRGAIGEVHAAARLGGRGQDGQGRAVRGGGPAGQVQRHRVVGRAHAPAEVGRHDALELGLRARHARRGAGQPQAARGQEPHGKRQRLLVREHHRRQLVARHEHVPAVTAVLDGDRDAEILEPRDVAPQGAAVHAQAGGQIRPAHLAVGLQQLQDGEDAGGGVIHQVSPWATLKSAVATSRKPTTRPARRSCAGRAASRSRAALALQATAP